MMIDQREELRGEACPVRRRLILAAPVLLSGFGWGKAQAALRRTRELSFVHAHTGESLEICYATTGGYQPDALQAIDHFLRDFRTGEETSMDPALLDLLFEVRRLAGSEAPFQVVSAYRSPQTNAMLAKRSKSVARKSLHMFGKAIDVRLPDVKTRRLRDIASSLEAGGVGYYRRANFVHLDTGPVRRW